MEFSEKIDLISAAMSKFQAEVTTAKKTSANPYFSSKYADLAEVWDTIKNPLCKNGLAVIQSPENNEGKVIITTLITHTSGQWIKGSLAMQPVKSDPQSYGSCITYGRRYSLGAFLGIATELDDDGNKASDLDTKTSPAAKAYEAKKAAAKTEPEATKTPALSTPENEKSEAAAKNAAKAVLPTETNSSALPFNSVTTPWTMDKIKAVVNDDLKKLFGKFQMKSGVIIEYWNAFNGDQDAIKAAIETKEVGK
jgi:hypothetical protein